MIYEYYVTYTYFSAVWGVGYSTLSLEFKLDSADAIKKCVNRVVGLHNKNNAGNHVSGVNVVLLNFTLLREVEGTLPSAGTL